MKTQNFKPGDSNSDFLTVDELQLAVQTALKNNQRAIRILKPLLTINLDDIQTGETQNGDKIYRAYHYNGQTFELCSTLANLQGDELQLSNVG